MNNLLLIIRREYLTRVRKRSFIISTLLTPIGFVVFFVALGFILSSGEDEQRLLVKDDTGLLGTLKSNGSIFFDNTTAPIDSVLATYREQKYDGVLHFSAERNTNWNNTLRVSYHSENQLGVATKTFIEGTIADKIENAKIDSAGYDRKVLDNFKTSVEVEPVSTKDGEEGKSASVILATGLGGLMGFIIYIVLLVYGTSVMRSVMEEKTNRIVEVMISVVRPFELMMGKIIGVGLVGLTQFAIWLGIIPILQLLLGLIFADQFSAMSQAPQPEGTLDAEGLQAMMQELGTLGELNFFKIIVLFLFFFLGGYLLYSSLFAAVGASMSDDLAEGQSLTFPITIPVILAVYIAIAVVQNPNSSLARWSSMVPFFSPVVMPARLPFNPPWWEIALSMLILLGSCIFFVWLSSRIYRVGILLYGKKVTLREMGKWIFTKG